MNVIPLGRSLGAFLIALFLLQSVSFGGQVDDPLPTNALLRIGTHRLRLDAAATACAFSDDGKVLVGLSKGNIVSRWDTSTGQLLSKVPACETPSGRVALSPTGTIFAVIDQTGSCRFREAQTGRIIREFACPADTWGKFVGSGGLFCVYGRNGPRRIWSVETGKPFPLDGSRGEFGDIRFEDGAIPGQVKSFDISTTGLIASTSAEGPVWLSDLNSGELLRKMEGPGEPFPRETKSLQLVAISPNGKSLVAQTSYGRILLFDADSGKLRTILRSPGPNVTGVITSDSKNLVAWSAKEAMVWDLQTGDLVGMPVSCPVEIQCAAGSKQIDKLAVGTESRTLMAFNVKDGGQLLGHLRSLDPDSHARFLADGGLIAAAAENNPARPNAIKPVQVWDGLSGKLAPSTHHECRHLSEISSDALAILHRYKHGVAVSFNGKVQTEVEVNLRNRKGDLDLRQLRALAIRPDGQYFLTAEESEEASTGIQLRPMDRVLQVRESDSGTIVLELGAFKSWQHDFLFSPDNRILAGWFEPWLPILSMSSPYRYTPDGRPLSLWDTSTGKHLAGFSSDGTRVGSFAFSSNGRFIASSENPSKPRLRLREVFTGHTSMVMEDELDFHGGVAFAPAGRYIAYCRPDGEICIRDLQTDKVVQKLPGHEGRVNSLDFAPDGRRLLSSGEDGTILVWDVAEILHTKATPFKVNPPIPELIRSLDGSDAGKASSAIHHLVGMGDRAVNPLGVAVSAILVAAEQRVVKVEQIERWITDLDSSEFKIRQAATDNLRANGDLAESAIRPALQKRPVLETRRRLELVLTSIENGTPLSPSLVFAIRAIEVLERIGSAQAKALLSKLAARAATFCTDSRRGEAIAGAAGEGGCEFDSLRNKLIFECVQCRLRAVAAPRSSPDTFIWSDRRPVRALEVNNLIVPRT